MSPRAAARLESSGFSAIYDYVPGKADWGSGGLQLEGDDPSARRVGARARVGVPTCRIGEPLRSVREAVARSGWDQCFVVDPSGIVLGRLGRRALAREDDVPVEEAMREGPGTVRPSMRLDRAVERMRLRDLTSLPVTTSDGRLFGLLLRREAEQALD